MLPARLPRILHFKGNVSWKLIAVLALFLLYPLLHSWSLVVPIYRHENKSLPPLYPALLDRERELPQHQVDLPFPEGKNGRYLRFGNQLWGVGLNNQLQETLLNTYIAHEANRAYVFTPFTWSLEKNEFVEIKADSHLASSPFGYPVRPARVPLTAYFDCPSTGAPWPSGDPAPRSVSLEWWNKICPENERLYINTTVVNQALGINMATDQARTIITKWSQYLERVEHGCVELLWGTGRIIDYDLVGSPRLESIWEDYSKSPVLTQFDWSPIVYAGVNRNIHLLEPSMVSRIWGKKLTGASAIPGLVTMHIRRGDYKHHCEWMAPFAEFNGWNKLSILPDRWRLPWSASTEEGETRTRYALSRCWVEIDDIVSRLDRTRVEHGATLHTLFISTNADGQWINDLKAALKGPKGVGWNVVTSKDLTLDWQQQGVDVVIDMEIASRGQVFIGNGFSSMSSTITRVRLIRGIPPAQSRLW